MRAGSRGTGDRISRVLCDFCRRTPRRKHTDLTRVSMHENSEIILFRGVFCFHLFLPVRVLTGYTRSAEHPETQKMENPLSSGADPLNLLAVAPSADLGLPMAGMSMEIADLDQDLNGAIVELVSWLPTKRWSVFVIHTNPRQSITVKPENLVAVGSQPPAVYESHRCRLMLECVQWSVGETPECRKRRRESLEREDADRAERRRRRIESLKRDEADRQRLLAEARVFEVRDAVARAKSADRTTELTSDVLVAVCYFLDRSHLGRLLFVCKAWSVAARAAAHDPTWQLTMLSADEFKRYTVRSNALPVSLTTRQRWVHVNPMKAKQTHSAQEAKAAGFTIEQMKAAGYDSYQCNMAGFSIEELTDAGHLGPGTHTAQEAKAAGFTIEQMKAAGYDSYQCNMAGFSIEELTDAGHLGPGTHTAQEAKAAGFTIEQMKAAGYRPYQCKVAGFSFEEASRAGFVTWGSERRDFWLSTGKYAGRGLDQIGRTYDW